MTITQDLAYVKAASLDDAVAALVDAGPGARVLAGGTDLIGWVRDDLVAPGLVVDLKGVPGLAAITAVDDRHIELGALVTFSDLLHSALVRDRAPVLVEMAHLMASVGIRNRATVVGNLCSAVPCADAAPVLLTYEAELTVVGPDGRRTVPVGEWFRGPRATALGPAEIATAVTVSLPSERHAGAFAKLARYDGEDLAQANLAVLALGDRTYRIAFGAVAPTPVRVPSTEAVLAGQTIDDRSVADAAAVVLDEIAPITDLRATREYRERMCLVMLDRALRAASARLAGGGPPYPSRFL